MKKKWFIRETETVQRSSDREIETVKLHLAAGDESLSFWVDIPYKDYLRMVESNKLDEHLLKMMENEEGAAGFLDKHLGKLKDKEITPGKGKKL